MKGPARGIFGARLTLLTSGRTAVPDETGSSTEKPAPQDRTDEYMTRELEKLQGIMASLRSRERDLIAVLRKKGATPPGPLYPEQKDLEELLRSRDEQVRSLREELQEERRARHDLKWSYESERLRREQAEKSLADASRELQDRMIAPALLEAFMRVSNLAGNVLDSIHDDLCPPALLHTHTTDLTHLASPDWD
ncbi:hypothetical protein K474DRAFT_439672 [Panus rudis PR-1116 ss-1]|nr:hypothetical protein K474DRAFT_439672 [Panus rudis PR-1116 ss-1]